MPKNLTYVTWPMTARSRSLTSFTVIALWKFKYPGLLHASVTEQTGLRIT